MITSQQTSLLYELRQIPIPEATLVELESRLQHRIHSMILDAFNKSGLSQKELTDRLGWNPARISRIVASASNLTLSTISALLAAIGVDLDDPSYTSFDELERRLKAPTPSRIGMAEPLMKTLRKNQSLGTNRPRPFLLERHPSGATPPITTSSAIGKVPDLPAMQPISQGAKGYDLSNIRMHQGEASRGLSR